MAALDVQIPPTQQIADSNMVLLAVWLTFFNQVVDILRDHEQRIEALEP